MRLRFNEKSLLPSKYLIFNVSLISRENAGALKYECTFIENLTPLQVVSAIEALSYIGIHLIVRGVSRKCLSHLTLNIGKHLIVRGGARQRPPYSSKNSKHVH